MAKQKTKGLVSLALGISLFAAGITLVKYHNDAASEIRKKVPERVWVVEKEITNLLRGGDFDLIEKVADPNVAEHYSNLFEEWGDYLNEPHIQSVRKEVDRHLDYSLGWSYLGAFGGAPLAYSAYLLWLKRKFAKPKVEKEEKSSDM